jgi:hypothetical protein
MIAAFLCWLYLSRLCLESRERCRKQRAATERAAPTVVLTVPNDSEAKHTQVNNSYVDSLTNRMHGID